MRVTTFGLAAIHRVVAASCALIGATATVEAATLAVPAALPSIQAAIVAAVDSDVVRVAPGPYHEHVTFANNDIVVMASALTGFTLNDGVSTSLPGEGGGIHLTAMPLSRTAESSAAGERPAGRSGPPETRRSSIASSSATSRACREKPAPT